MINVLKMDFYKLFHQKIFYVIIIVITSMNLLFSIPLSNNEKDDNSIVVIHNEGESVTSYESISDCLVDSFTGNAMPMIIIIFIVLFLGGTKRVKYEKNIISSVKKRKYFIFSEFIISAFSILIFLLLNCGVSFIANIFLSDVNKNLPLGDIKIFILFFISYYILLLGLSQIIYLLTLLFKNHILLLILSLLYASGIPYGLMEIFLNILNINFSVTRNFLLGIILSITDIYEVSYFIQGMITSVILGGLAFALSIYINNNRDIDT